MCIYVRREKRKVRGNRPLKNYEHPVNSYSNVTDSIKRRSFLQNRNEDREL